jgi:hypothetical protein
MSPESNSLENSDRKRLQELTALYEGLYRGLRDREDVVSWRTLTVDLRESLDSPSPKDVPPPIESLEKGRNLVEKLTFGTYMYPLRDEILWALYGSKNEHLILPPKESINPIEYLLINGRHKPEPLLWTLADYLKSQGKTVAVMNPIGHYSDGESRTVEFPLLIHPVKKAIIVASTQKREGGDFDLLTETIRAVLRNPNSAYMIENLDVNMPIFGGSRSHTAGQDEEIGYEVRVVIHRPKILTLMVKDIEKCLRENPRVEIRKHVLVMRDGLLIFPHVSFSTVDIHNAELPAKKIPEEFEFKSISPAKEQAEECLKILIDKKKEKFPCRVISCDEGSDERTNSFARELLKIKEGKLHIICIDKERSEAGKLKKVEVGGVFECEIDGDGNLVKREIDKDNIDLREECNLIYIDDMIDSGGTASGEIKLLKRLFEKTKRIIFIASHPVFSKGIKVIDKIGADDYIIGNSLSSKGLEKRKNVRVIDFAPAIAREL